jgi:anti-sigma B factor antagonist
MLTDASSRVDVGADGTVTVRLSGPIGADNLVTVGRALDCAGGSGPLVVDLTDVTFLDQAGVNLLADVAGDRGLELVLGPGCAVFPVVQVSGLDQVAVTRWC